MCSYIVSHTDEYFTGYSNTDHLYSNWSNSSIHKYLRNEFNFWNVHGIMNTWGLLQSK